MTMRQLCLRDIGVGPQVLAAIRLLFPDGTLSMGLAAHKRSADSRLHMNVNLLLIMTSVHKRMTDVEWIEIDPHESYGGHVSS